MEDIMINLAEALSNLVAKRDALLERSETIQKRIKSGENSLELANATVKFMKDAKALNEEAETLNNILNVVQGMVNIKEETEMSNSKVVGKA